MLVQATVNVVCAIMWFMLMLKMLEKGRVSFFNTVSVLIVKTAQNA